MRIRKLEAAQVAIVTLFSQVLTTHTHTKYTRSPNIEKNQYHKCLTEKIIQWEETTERWDAIFDSKFVWYHKHKWNDSRVLLEHWQKSEGGCNKFIKTRNKQKKKKKPFRMDIVVKSSEQQNTNLEN